MAAAPDTLSNWPTDGAISGEKTKNQSRKMMKNEAFSTRPESSPLTGAGALAWASGSQKCKGKRAVFINRPTIISEAAHSVTASACTESASSCQQTVP
jgi:hypothetical protein